MSVETPADGHKETHGFQTEVRHILDLMIHSLYSNKEIFMRELISNASDAADKLRFEALQDETLFEGEGELDIHVSFDKQARTLSITDNGIGMSRDEVVEHIGTIAKSGTRQFFESLTGDQAKDSQLIGQFGVGFYSSFIVADKVTLTTRKAGLPTEQGVRWESDGQGEYSIEDLERPLRGTTVTLHMKEGEDEFLDDYRLRAIVNKYSDHISLPIMMAKQVHAGAEDDEAKAEEPGDEAVNKATALWTRNKGDISDEEYNEFYKHVAHDFDEPIAHVHSRVEGNLEYTSLLYIPKRAPFDLWDRNSRHGVKLYVRRVYIMDDAEHLMPPYLRFVRGVIDSSDLPLNVSREILQQSREIDSIRAGSVKKVLGMLEGMARNEPEKYAEFWGEFARPMKEGAVEDQANRERLSGLLRFASTKGEGDTEEVSLDAYIERMPEGQKDIYFMTGESFQAAASSPHLEIFRKKDVEVLLLTDTVDEWLVGHINEYKDKNLVSVTKGDLDLGELDDKEEKEKAEQAADTYKELITKVKEVLGESVQAVRTTHRLTDSPACLVSGENDMGGNLERILKAAGQQIASSKPILELNPEHPLVERLNGSLESGRFEDLTRIVFDQALLAEGGQLEDPAAFVRRLNQMLLEVVAD